MMKKNILQISNYLDELFIDPKCELEYNRDYELLIAVMMSAQTTDKGVNKVNRVLFKKYDSLEKLSNANIEDIKSIIKPIGNYNKKSVNIILWSYVWSFRSGFWSKSVICEIIKSSIKENPTKSFN